MNAQQLKIDLKAIKENNYEVKSEEELKVYITEMMKYIGHTDPVLRDELIYTTMEHLVLVKKNIDHETLRFLFDELLNDDHLFYNINKKDDTSIYKRTFSSLAVIPILRRHSKEDVLTEKQMAYFRLRMIDYIIKEKDFRGFDNQNGWAHAFAHWSDSTYFLTYGLEDATVMMKSCLDAIQVKLMTIDTILTREEDERLCTNIVYNYIDESMIDSNAFSIWLDGFEDALIIKDVMFKETVKVNIKQFLRSLYFRMRHLNIGDDFIDPVINLEKKFNSYLYN